MNNPFFALLSEDANEDHGEVFGFSLVYSGSFVGEVEVDQFIQLACIWALIPSISAGPRAGRNLSDAGSRYGFSPLDLAACRMCYHELYRTRLCRDNSGIVFDLFLLITGKQPTLTLLLTKSRPLRKREGAWY